MRLSLRRGGGPQLSAAEREEMQATMLEFAACMRKNGVDMADPRLCGGGGGFFRAGPGGNGGGGVDPDDPDFRRRRRPASRSCRQPSRRPAGPEHRRWACLVKLMHGSQGIVVGGSGRSVSVAGLAVAAVTGGTETAAATTAESAATVAVVRRDLVTRDDVGRHARLRRSRVLSRRGPGVVTKLPHGRSRSSVADKTLARDQRASVRLLYGATPMWRRLEKGVADGADVEQLERNLLELGHDPSGMTVDDHFDGATANAVKATGRTPRSRGDRRRGAERRRLSLRAAARRAALGERRSVGAARSRHRSRRRRRGRWSTSTSLQPTRSLRSSAQRFGRAAVGPGRPWDHHEDRAGGRDDDRRRRARPVSRPCRSR